MYDLHAKIRKAGHSAIVGLVYIATLVPCISKTNTTSPAWAESRQRLIVWRAKGLAHETTWLNDENAIAHLKMWIDFS